ncbi:EAL domain-containing protein [Citrobacter werkmanii]|uniref:EAL domain-containing protein n=1 Tax=Citrobacter werkmanii TaxID=67827 RepID=UPI002F2D2C83
MNIYLNNKIYDMIFIFEPIMKNDNSQGGIVQPTVYALELLTRFRDNRGMNISPQVLFSTLSAEEKFLIFKNQLMYIGDNINLIRSAKVLISVNIDFQIVKNIYLEKNTQSLIRNLNQSLVLELTENFWSFPECIRYTHAEKKNFLFNIMAICDLWLDDFGSSSSNFDSLFEGFFSAIKISQTFVSNLSTDDSGLNVIYSVCNYINATGSLCIIEGVENDSIMSKLDNISPVYMQGYLWRSSADLYSLIKIYGAN